MSILEIAFLVGSLLETSNNDRLFQIGRGFKQVGCLVGKHRRCKPKVDVSKENQTVTAPIEMLKFVLKEMTKDHDPQVASRAAQYLGEIEAEQKRIAIQNAPKLQSNSEPRVVPPTRSTPEIEDSATPIIKPSSVPASPKIESNSVPRSTPAPR